MDLILLKISHNVFSLTNGSPKVAHPRNSASIQAEDSKSHALVVLLHEKKLCPNVFGDRNKSKLHLISVCSQISSSSMLGRGNHVRVSTVFLVLCFTFLI